MTTYNVHIYREMRLTFERIEADSLEAAASIARDKPTGDADGIDDCEGESFSALVDVVGDEEYEQSRFIDFEPDRLRQAAPLLLDALKWITCCPMIRGPVGTTAYIVSDEKMAQAKTAVAEAEPPASAPSFPIHLEITEEAFDDHYPLKLNHLNPNASWGDGEGKGCLFETYGDELAFVRRQDPHTVWTFVDGDESDQYLLSGFHVVNRIGYLVSKVPVPDGVTIQVRIPSPSENAQESDE